MRHAQCAALLLAIAIFAISVVAEIVPADPAKNITWPYQAYKTVDFKPPYLNITRYEEPSEGYLFFVANSLGTHKPYEGSPGYQTILIFNIW